ncbi:hypothetical protein [Scytonema millei]|nr:hypothetical protein [Scytonema millei]
MRRIRIQNSETPVRAGLAQDSGLPRRDLRAKPAPTTSGLLITDN